MTNVVMTSFRVHKIYMMQIFIKYGRNIPVLTDSNLSIRNSSFT